jgi:putative transcription factor
MNTCDLCASTKGPFSKGNVEGTMMTLCSSCASFGKDARPIKTEPITKKKTTQTTAYQQPTHETIQLITPDYANRIKKARERKGIKQEDYAKNIGEKTSLLQSLEAGKHEPSIDLARKLEKTLHITLVITHEETGVMERRNTSGTLTLADVMKQDR